MNTSPDIEIPSRVWISDTVSVLTVKVTHPGSPSATSVNHEIHCVDCDMVEIFEHLSHAIHNAHRHHCHGRSMDETLAAMVEHGRVNPTHGYNCACKDRWLRIIRNRLTDKAMYDEFRYAATVVNR